MSESKFIERTNAEGGIEYVNVNYDNDHASESKSQSGDEDEEKMLNWKDIKANAEKWYKEPGMKLKPL